jgi:hypothetical protein
MERSPRAPARVLILALALLAGCAASTAIRATGYLHGDVRVNQTAVAVVGEADLMVSVPLAGGAVYVPVQVARGGAWGRRLDADVAWAGPLSEAPAWFLELFEPGELEQIAGLTE